MPRNSGVILLINTQFPETESAQGGLYYLYETRSTPHPHPRLLDSRSQRRGRTYNYRSRWLFRGQRKFSGRAQIRQPRRVRQPVDPGAGRTNADRELAPNHRLELPQDDSSFLADRLRPESAELHGNTHRDRVSPAVLGAGWINQTHQQ